MKSGFWLGVPVLMVAACDLDPGGLQICGGDGQCPRANVFAGDYPQNRNSNFASEIQGVAHDAEHWFFSQDFRLLKFALSQDLNAVGSADALATALIPGALQGLGYNHFGDFEQFGGFLFVPLEGGIPPRVAVFRASDLAFVTSQELRLGDGTPMTHGAWLAIHPTSGELFTSNGTLSSSDPIRIFTLNPQALTTDLPGSFLQFSRNFPTITDNGTPVTLQILQGGAFDDEGCNLYLSHGNATDDVGGGLKIVDATTGVLLETSVQSAGIGDSSFLYAFNIGFPMGQEPEGLTFFNLPAGTNAPGIRGALHAIVLENIGPDWFFKHYHVCQSGQTITAPDDLVTCACSCQDPAGGPAFPVTIQGCGIVATSGSACGTVCGGQACGSAQGCAIGACASTDPAETLLMSDACDSSVSDPVPPAKVGNYRLQATTSLSSATVRVSGETTVVPVQSGEIFFNAPPVPVSGSQAELAQVTGRLAPFTLFGGTVDVTNAAIAAVTRIGASFETPSRVVVGAQAGRFLASFSVDGTAAVTEAINVEPIALILDLQATPPRFLFEAHGTAGNAGELTLHLEGIVTNQAPRANAGSDQVVECASPAGANVSFSGSSTDPDGSADILRVQWFEGATPLGVQTSFNTQLARGIHDLSFHVYDQILASGADQVVVTVRDTTPPTVTAPANIAVSSCGMPQDQVSLGVPSASDACSAESLQVTGTIVDVNGITTSITVTPTTLFSVGTSIVSWKAVDASGNIGTASQQVTRTVTGFGGPGCLPAFSALTADGDVTMAGNSVVYGNVGISPSDFLRLTSSNNHVTGSATVFPSTSQVVLTGFSTVSGGIITHDLSVSGDAIENATRVSAAAASQTATPGFPTSISQSGNSDLTLQPINPGGTNILNLSLFNLQDNADLTLVGNASTTYIINVSGSFTLAGNSNIILSGGLLATNVLFNIVGTGTAAMSGRNSILRGLYLAPARAFAVSSNSDVTGRVFARSISLSGNSDITGI